jgi:hypothetical protein
MRLPLIFEYCTGTSGNVMLSLQAHPLARLRSAIIAKRPNGIKARLADVLPLYLDIFNRPKNKHRQQMPQNTLAANQAEENAHVRASVCALVSCWHRQPPSVTRTSATWTPSPFLSFVTSAYPAA